MIEGGRETRPTGPAWAPQATVFVSSFCIMVIELVAGRIVSRHLGSSLYTWTSVIGVVLAGIAVGNYLGGLLADRRPARPTLAVLFVASSLACVTVTMLNHVVGEWVVLWGLPWALRVGTHIAVVFLLPSVVLGMISPVAAKMALDRSRETGRTIGSVYAWGVVGSIAGTFATGFWLVAAFGTTAVVWAVCGVLAAMGLVYGLGRRLPWLWAGALAGLAVLGTGPWTWAEELGERLQLRVPLGDDVIWSDESQYSHVRVHRVSDDPDTRNLHLDKLIHSKLILDRPYDLQYGYERIYAAVTRTLAGDRDSLNTLTIGGGGYILPRWIDGHYPRSRTEVVEIDPAVTRAALEAFGLPADHGFVVAHEDGRARVRRLVEQKRRGGRMADYDLVYLDVFDDYSVPYQLTTVEYLRQLDELLAPDGAFLMNLIDVYAIGDFIGSMIATMEEVFPQVTVLAEGPPVSAAPEGRNTYILVAAKRPVDLTPVIEEYDPSIRLHRLTGSEMEALRARGRLLTDDWAPVENLLAPVVRRSAREIAATQLVQRARQALVGGDPRSAEATAARAVKLHPATASAHEIRGRALLQEGDRAGAIAAFRETLAHRPGDVEIWYLLGVLLRAHGKPAEAVPVLERTIQLAPDRLEARNELGVALAESGRLQEAVTRFSEVLARDPRHEKAWQNLQAARRMLGGG